MTLLAFTLGWFAGTVFVVLLLCGSRNARLSARSDGGSDGDVVKWLRRNNFPVLCGCCGKLVIQCWENEHNKACDACVGHFWQCGPTGDKPCNGRELARALREDVLKPYEAAKELLARGITGHAPDCAKMGVTMRDYRETACTCGFSSRYQEEKALREIEQETAL